MSVKQISYDEWIDTYHPMQNPYEESSFDGNLFETYGEALLEVQATDPLNIWTLVEKDSSDELVILEGFHVVNVLGYFLTEKQRDNKDQQFIIDLND